MRYWLCAIGGTVLAGGYGFAKLADKLDATRDGAPSMGRHIGLCPGRSHVWRCHCFHFLSRQISDTIET
jgi:hypothetical protein